MEMVAGKICQWVKCCQYADSEKNKRILMDDTSGKRGIRDVRTLGEEGDWQQCGQKWTGGLAVN